MNVPAPQTLTVLLACVILLAFVLLTHAPFYMERLDLLEWDVLVMTMLNVRLANVIQLTQGYVYPTVLAQIPLMILVLVHLVINVLLDTVNLLPTHANHLVQQWKLLVHTQMAVIVQLETNVPLHSVIPTTYVTLPVLQLLVSKHLTLLDAIALSALNVLLASVQQIIHANQNAKVVQ